MTESEKDPKCDSCNDRWVHMGSYLCRKCKDPNFKITRATTNNDIDKRIQDLEKDIRRAIADADERNEALFTGILYGFKEGISLEREKSAKLIEALEKIAVPLLPDKCKACNHNEKVVSQALEQYNKGDK